MASLIAAPHSRMLSRCFKPAGRTSRPSACKRAIPTHAAPIDSRSSTSSSSTTSNTSACNLDANARQDTAAESTSYSCTSDYTWFGGKLLSFESDLQSRQCLSLLGFGLIAVGSLAATDSAVAADLHASADSLHTTATHFADIAEGQEFWSNVARYGRYFVTVMLGTTYVMTKPFTELFKRPLTAILAIALLGGGIYFLKFTLAAMLGVDEPFEYTPSSPVTYADSPYLGSF